MSLSVNLYILITSLSRTRYEILVDLSIHQIYLFFCIKKVSLLFEKDLSNVSKLTVFNLLHLMNIRNQW